MHRFIFCALLFTTMCFGQKGAHRPKITGIDHVDFFTTNPDGNRHLYVTLLGLEAVTPVEDKQTQRFRIGSQWVGYSPAPDSSATDRMDHVAFRTDDCAALRSYLASKGVKVPASLSALKDKTLSFQIHDPEGHLVEFVQGSLENGGGLDRKPGESDPVSQRMIHTGFIVRDRATEDRFYKDILGFRLYWHGGMKDGDTDWAAMQVPDGTDWLEYMLNVDAKPDLQLTGVMNHISLGVTDMKQAEAKLSAHGWKPHDADDHPEIGKDGKWQFDVFDPDFSRVELMEFTPVQKPCCSDFTAPHPHE